MASFAELLKSYRVSHRVSRNELARRSSVDPSYLTRLEHGERAPARRGIIEAISKALDLNGVENRTFLAAAGYVPFENWDETLDMVAELLHGGCLNGTTDSYRTVIQEISKLYLEHTT